MTAFPGERTTEHRPAGVTATPFQWCDPSSIPTRQWLFGRHAIRKYVSLTVASGGTGKTAQAIAEALALVSGKDLLRDSLMTAGCPLPVWYIGLEDPLEEYQRRVAGAALHYELTPNDLGGLFLDSGREQDFVVAHENRLGLVIVAPIVSSVIEQIRRHGVALVIVDPFVGCHTLPESDNSKIAAVVRQWAHIAEETGAAVELVHHIRKGGSGTAELSADDARGASAIVNAARSVRLLSQMTAEEAMRASVSERRRYFRITFGKANMALPAEAGTWRELRTVSLGNGSGGPDDLVGVAAAWTWPSALDGVTVDHLRRVQKAISGGMWREDSRAADWAGKAVAEVLDLNLADPFVRAKVGELLKTWLLTGVLKIVERPDPKQRKAFKYVEVGAWA